MIGEGTKKKFLERGIYPDFMPSVYDGNTLGKELGALFKWNRKDSDSKSLPLETRSWQKN